MRSGQEVKARTNCPNEHLKSVHALGWACGSSLCLTLMSIILLTVASVTQQGDSEAEPRLQQPGSLLLPLFWV